MCDWKMLFYYQIQQNSASVVISVLESTLKWKSHLRLYFLGLSQILDMNKFVFLCGTMKEENIKTFGFEIILRSIKYK